MQLHQEEEIPIPFPMVEVGEGFSQEDNTWNQVTKTIFSFKFKHMLTANQKDDIYLDFLQKMTTSLPKKVQRTMRMRSSSSFPEDPLSDPAFRVVDLYRKYRKPFYKAVNMLVKDSLVTVNLNSHRQKLVQSKMCDYTKHRPKNKRSHSHFETRVVKPTIKSSPSYKFERQRDEAHFLGSITDHQLHLLVLSLILEKKGFKNAKVFQQRSKSSELKVDGGKAKRLMMSAELTEHQWLKVLHNRSCLAEKKDKVPPWYLDRNPNSIADSLVALKAIIARHATTREKVIVNFFAALAQQQSAVRALDQINEPQAETKAMIKDLSNRFRNNSGLRR